MRSWFSVLLLTFGFTAAAVAEEVTLTHDGLTLNANLEKVAGNWPAGPVVLMTHGTLAYGGMEIMRGLQSMLKERGLSSLAVTLSLGVDNRHGMYDCAVPHRHKHTDAVAEIGAWAAWLKTQGVQRLALLGHSRGGNQTARYAASVKDPGIVAVFLLAPQTWDAQAAARDYEQRYGTELAGVLHKAQALVAAGQGDTLLDPVDFIYCDQARATATAFVSYYGADPDMDTPHIVPRIPYPVTVFAGSEDTVVAGLIDKMAPLADDERVRLQVIDGAEHFFRDLYSEEIADAVADQLNP